MFMHLSKGTLGPPYHPHDSIRRMSDHTYYKYTIRTFKMVWMYWEAISDSAWQDGDSCRKEFVRIRLLDFLGALWFTLTGALV